MGISGIQFRGKKKAAAVSPSLFLFFLPEVSKNKKKQFQKEKDGGLGLYLWKQ